MKLRPVGAIYSVFENKPYYLGLRAGTNEFVFFKNNEELETFHTDTDVYKYTIDLMNTHDYPKQEKLKQAIKESYAYKKYKELCIIY